MRRATRSKLHKSFKKKLGLTTLGFRSECWVGRYRVDECNFDRRVIVEIHGDAVHGNPREYAGTDNLPYGMTANEKWDLDGARQTFLEEHGWHVIIVWESDDLIAKKRLIEMVLRTSDVKGL